MKKLISVFILTCLCFNLFAQNIPSYVPTNGLVAYYPFNGNANDESGNGNIGVVNGATLTTDRFGNDGKAYSFDGISNYITVTNSEIINCSNVSISVWFNADDFIGETNQNELVSKREYTGWGNSYEIGIGKDPNACWGNANCENAIYTSYTINNQNYINVYNSNSSLQPNNWYNFVYVHDSNNVSLFLNGIRVNSNQSPGSLTTNNTLPVWFGARPGGGGRSFFNGKLDDIAIYNRALTQEEITALYQGTSTNNSNNGSVGINTTTPHPSAALDITDTQRGLLIPRMTASQRNNITNPAEGLMVFQTNDSTGFWFYSSQKWNTINSKGIKGDQGLQGVQGDRGLQGPAGNGFQNGTSKGQMMYWNDSAWVTVSPGQYGQSLVYCDGVPSWGGCLPKLNTSSVGNISSTSATIGGNITNDGGSSITARGVCWSTSQNPTVDLVTKTVDGAGLGSYTSTITGFSTNSNYYVRAYATNSAGTSYGDEVSFTTLSIPSTINNGLVAYYPFNGNANDESGNGNNGVVNGASLTTDRFGNSGKAYSFDGSNKIACGSSASFNISNNYSFSFWYKKNGNGGVVLSKDDGGGEQNKYIIGVDAYPNQGDFIHWNTNQSHTQGLWKITNTSVDGNWNHIVWQFKDNQINIYRNGLFFQSFVLTYPIPSISSEFFIGYAEGWFWNGLLDDIRIYNRALSQEEITYLATH